MTDETAAELRRLAGAVECKEWVRRSATRVVDAANGEGVAHANHIIDWVADANAAFIAAANPATVLDLLNERDEAKAAWERLHVEHANLRLDRDEEVSRLKQWASAGLSAFHGRLCSGVGGAGVTDDARTCHDPKCVAWAKALEGTESKTPREIRLEEALKGVWLGSRFHRDGPDIVVNVDRRKWEAINEALKP